MATQDSEIAVPGTFLGLSGSLDAAHQTAWVEIGLDRVDTQDPERDRNLRRHFFETDQFPRARVVISEVELEGASDPNTAVLAIGEARAARVQADLELRGAHYPIVSRVRITREGPERIRVTSRDPILVASGDVGLRAQFTLLEVGCGIGSISEVVTVEVDLVFAGGAD